MLEYRESGELTNTSPPSFLLGSGRENCCGQYTYIQLWNDLSSDDQRTGEERYSFTDIDIVSEHLKEIIARGRCLARGSQPILRPINMRLLAATNRNPLAMCEKGNFRWDLYYRLAASVIDIPLSDSAGTISLCWPGNIRQLEHVLHQAYLLTPEETIALNLVQEAAGEAARRSRQQQLVRCLRRIRKT